ncbi:hypothetical protein MWU60_07685 [Yoonia sp. F2084L]|uniref:hypothetical protein n=1 Tax=Yoonia sp. F2084L TaxID=2926419 RepID=UPI001FF4C0CE|nr:hypothetical protein [Yoonia sp. F2084L]MCK0095448.1 hypothetical protein [Yoonia sp. F2084L]
MQRLAALRLRLPESYGSFFTAPPVSGDAPQLMALCVDLMRKQHSALPFEALTPHERKMVLHAHAVDVLPGWMSRYASLWLSPQNRRLVGQLRDIKSSRPNLPKVHFGAIKHQQQLRSASKS